MPRMNKVRLLITPDYVINTVCKLTGRNKKVLKFKRIPPDFTTQAARTLSFLKER